MVSPDHHLTTRVNPVRIFPALDRENSDLYECGESGEHQKESWLCMEKVLLDKPPAPKVCKKILLTLTCQVDDCDTGSGHGEQDYQGSGCDESGLLSTRSTGTSLRSNISLKRSGVDTNGY